MKEKTEQEVTKIVFEVWKNERKHGLAVPWTLFAYNRSYHAVAVLILFVDRQGPAYILIEQLGSGCGDKVAYLANWKMEEWLDLSIAHSWRVNLYPDAGIDANLRCEYSNLRSNHKKNAISGFTATAIATTQVDASDLASMSL
jgi:hypothetical protein